MRICVVDGRGGGLGSQLVERLCQVLDDRHEILGLGMNRAAADAMAKAGATQTVAGEGAVLQMLDDADLILGSLNIILAGALLGEVSDGLAAAILRARGHKMLLPLNRANLEVVGIDASRLEPLIDLTVQRVQSLLDASTRS